MFAFTCLAPGPVLNLGVSVLDRYTIRVTFDPPDQPNGVIEGYSVTYSGTAQVCSNKGK